MYSVYADNRKSDIIFKLNDYHILFDIAKINKKNDLLNKIESFFGNKLIDIFVISHFHFDHMGGLEKLLDSGFTFKKIYIPYFQPDMIIIINLIYIFSIVSYQKRKNINKNSNSDAIFLSNLIENYSNIDLFKTNLFKKDLIDLFEKYDSSTQIVEIKDNTEDIYDNYWKFIYLQTPVAPFKINDFKNELRRIGIQTSDDLKKEIKTKYLNIKKIYKKIFKNHNLTSMYLVHGPMDSSKLSKTKFCGKVYIANPKFKFEYQDKFYSLISGDCSFELNSINLQKYANQLTYALVPHHSSIESWTNDLCIMNKDIVWIVTISKVASRPYGKIVKDIYDNGQVLYICDSTDSFEYDFL